MQRSAVFEQTFQDYLKKIGQIDLSGCNDMLGVHLDKGGLIISLYDRKYRLSADGIEAYTGSPDNPAVRVILCKYVLMCPQELPRIPERLMTYREFKGAGPLTSYFTANTNKILETTFSNKLDLLRERSLRMGGTVIDNEAYDFSVQFDALPRIPVIVNFNDRDEMFPAACSILYRASAEHFLDMECLAMTGTLLAGTLVGSKQ